MAKTKFNWKKLENLKIEYNRLEDELVYFDNLYTLADKYKEFLDYAKDNFMTDAEKLLREADRVMGIRYDVNRKKVFDCDLDCAEFLLKVVERRINYVKERTGL